MLLYVNHGCMAAPVIFRCTGLFGTLGVPVQRLCIQLLIGLGTRSAGRVRAAEAKKPGH